MITNLVNVHTYSDVLFFCERALQCGRNEPYRMCNDFLAQEVYRELLKTNPGLRMIEALGAQWFCFSSIHVKYVKRLVFDRIDSMHRELQELESVLSSIT